MLRRAFWLVILMVACTTAQSGDPSVGPGRAAGAADRTAPLASTQSPTVISVSPDHGQAGDVITITGSGFGLDQSQVRVRFGGAPADVVSLRETGDGYQQIEVELNHRSVSGPVSVYATDQWTTFNGSFCAQPVIHDLVLIETGDGMTVQVSGTNFDPRAVVYVGDTPHEPQRIRTGRSPHRSDPTLLFVTVQPDTYGPVWVQNPCPDGRNYAAPGEMTFSNTPGQ